MSRWRATKCHTPSAFAALVGSTELRSEAEIRAARLLMSFCDAVSASFISRHPEQEPHA
jgi:folate-dependent tRNA-U54 methylase TrmFO/GidA